MLNKSHTSAVTFLPGVHSFWRLWVCHNLTWFVQVSYKSTQRQVNITVRKEQRGWWERLTAQERKPIFLSPDFDRWLDESDAEMEIREKVGFQLLLHHQSFSVAILII